MFKHIFPNALGYMVTSFALAIPSFVFTEASYAYLGIINYSNAISVGMLLEQGQQVMGSNPHMLIFPSFYIAILMITFNLFGNGLRDAFNPSLRGTE
jgi:oligopeptide transport system permease protein